MSYFNTFTACFIIEAFFAQNSTATANNEKEKSGENCADGPKVATTIEREEAETPKIQIRKTETPRKSKRIIQINEKNKIEHCAEEAKKCIEKRRKKSSQMELLLLTNTAVLREIVQCNFYFVGIPSVDESDAIKSAKILSEKIDQFAEKSTEHLVMKRIRLNLAFITMSLEKYFQNYSTFFEALKEKTTKEIDELFRDFGKMAQKFNADGTENILNLESVKPKLLYYFFFSCFYRNLMLRTNLSDTMANKQLLSWLYSMEKAMDGRMSEIIGHQNPSHSVPKKATNE